MTPTPPTTNYHIRVHLVSGEPLTARSPEAESITALEEQMVAQLSDSNTMIAIRSRGRTHLISKDSITAITIEQITTH